MNYNTIAYKIENDIIVNTISVLADEELQAGFIRSPHPLNIGFVKSFGDFYPPGTTQEKIDTYRNVLGLRVDGDLEVTNAELQDLEKKYPEQTEDGEPIVIDEDIHERKLVLLTYISYLQDLKLNIDKLPNPIQYQYKTIGEV